MNEEPVRENLASQLPKPKLDVSKIQRPAPQLLTYYIIVAILTVPAVIVVLPMLWFRYVTLRYKFDEEGISMSWGYFFRREILLTYRKIQDIHLTRGILQRWMGLATVSVQTASGNATPEIAIEGILEAEELRDFLYEKMRGAKMGPPTPAADSTEAPGDQAVTLLKDIRDNLARLLEARKGQS